MRFLVPGLLLAWCLPVAAQDELPPGKGKETLENTCTECHGLDKILSALRSPERWRAIVTEMKSKGATMSDSELDTLVEYLSQNFGTVEDSASKINVNRATAKELENVLELTARQAEAIVRYRETKGPFKIWNDLLKVSGLDKAKIEAKRDRLTF